LPHCLFAVALLLEASVNSNNRKQLDGTVVNAGTSQRARAPSTMLRMVPLPRFAGAETTSRAKCNPAPRCGKVRMTDDRAGRTKRGEFAVAPAPPGTWPDLSGLSCRFEEFRGTRGVVLSVLIVPAPGADGIWWADRRYRCAGRYQPKCRMSGTGRWSALRLAAARRRA
jgi:hypothetical protein